MKVRTNERITNMDHQRRAKSVRVGAGAVAAATLCVLGGCLGMGNVNYPPIEGQTAGSNLNQPAARNVMATALVWATNRYPPVPGSPVGEQYQGPLAVNFPPGVDPEAARMIESELERKNPRAMALTGESMNVPRYHVTRVVVRGTDAIVDVLVPRSNLGPGTQGEQLYTGVSIDLRGGLRPWQVVAHRTFPVALADVPAPNPIVN